MRQGGRLGKLTALAWLLREHGEVLEADLLREYGVDLLDLYRGRVSLRRISVLIDGLSPDCKTSRRLANLSEVYDEWTQTDMLLGRLLEVQIEEEVLPREKGGSTSSSSTSARHDIPVVSLEEAMGLVTTTPEQFWESHA